MYNHPYKPNHLHHSTPPPPTTTITTTPPPFTPQTTTTTTTQTQFDSLIDDWNTPFSNEELEAIDAALEAASASTSTCTSISSTTLYSSPSSSLKTPRSSFSINDVDPNSRPTARRRLPGSISGSNGELGSPFNSGYFTLASCSKKSNSYNGNVKMKYPPLNFGGRIVYSRTTEEVEEATVQILKSLERRNSENSRAVFGLDIEWKPSFDRGIPQGKAAVMQICGDMTHCYVLHIFHSGIPGNLQYFLENSAFIKVGVGIDNDAVKVFHDHNVSIKSVEDLSSLANLKLGGIPKQWSLSGLVETLTCKQLLKPKKIRLGNWETENLSKAQLQYAATDAFASWYLYEVLNSFPDLPENQNSEGELKASVI